MKLELWYPVKPHSINQVFGGNPEYYSRFHDQFGNPEKGHNGQDMMAFHGQPVYAACDGLASYTKDDHGGEGIIIASNPMDYEGTQVSFHVINWHLCGDTDPKYPSPIPLDGKQYPVKAGDLIGHADNTGAPFESSGDHLHFGLCPYTLDGRNLHPDNGFNGCIDPAPFFNGSYAVDIPELNVVTQEVEQATQKTNALVDLFKRLFNLK